MESFVIRRATVEDALKIAEQQRNYYEEGQSADTVGLPDGVERTTEVLRQTIFCETASIWLALDHDKTLAYAELQYLKTVVGHNRFSGVMAVYTRPEYRGRGIGTRLLERVQQWAREEGREIVILWSHSAKIPWPGRVGGTFLSPLLTGCHKDGKAPIMLRMLGEDDADWGRMARWLKSAPVAEFYREDADIERVRAKFEPRTQAESRIHPRIILYQEVPVGYAQFYELSQAELKQYQLFDAVQWGGFDLFT